MVTGLVPDTRSLRISFRYPKGPTPLLGIDPRKENHPQMVRVSSFRNIKLSQAHPLTRKEDEIADLRFFPTSNLATILKDKLKRRKEMEKKRRKARKVWAGFPKIPGFRPGPMVSGLDSSISPIFSIRPIWQPD